MIGKCKLNKKEDILTWTRYFDENINIHKYKIPELKKILRFHKLRVTGKKSILIERILEHFVKCKNVVKIQSLIRKHAVTLTMKLRGPGLYDRKICVNDKDFFTLEPINEIDIYDFFSFKDEKDFIYGFDLNSLIIMMKKPGSLYNPYNRDKIPFYVIKNLTTLSKLSKHLQPNHKMGGQNEHCNNLVRNTIVQKMISIREKPDNDRINHLFYEIDSLGNYSSSSWFKNLNTDMYINLLRNLWDIWSYRANIPTLVKRRICPYFNPFHDGLEDLNIRERNNMENIEIIRKACLTVMENIILTGITDEYRQLGAMHVLSALTLVSIPARANLPWLYESVSVN